MNAAANLVICDFDNTLVDSERINAELFVRFFHEEASIESTREDREYVDSAAFLDIIKRYRSIYSHRLHTASVEDLAQRFLEFKRREISSFTVRRAEGLQQLLEAPVPLAIVSGSYTAEIEAVARAAGLPLDRFSPVLGSDQYHPWKPDPAGLLRAARMCGARPDRTLVLEDSISGLTAAKRAGMIPLHVAEFSSLSPEGARAVGALSFTDLGEVCRSRQWF